MKNKKSLRACQFRAAVGLLLAGSALLLSSSSALAQDWDDQGEDQEPVPAPPQFYGVPGHWEIVPMGMPPQFNNPAQYSADTAAYNAELAKRYQGTITSTWSRPLTTSSITAEYPSPPLPETPYAGTFAGSVYPYGNETHRGNRNSIAWDGHHYSDGGSNSYTIKGGPGATLMDGTCRALLHWVSGMILYNYLGQVVRDAAGNPITDDPSPSVMVKITASATANSTDVGPYPPVNGVDWQINPTVEHANVSLGIADDNGNTIPENQITAQGQILLPPARPIRSASVAKTYWLRLLSYGRRDFWTPQITLHADASLDKDRESFFPGSGNGGVGSTPSDVIKWNMGVNEVIGHWDTELFNLTFLPDPDRLALDDGVRIPYVAPAPLNQYVIDAGMPTSIKYTGSNPSITAWLQSNVSWNLVGTAPALRPVDTIITTPSSVAPGHYPQVFPLSPTPIPAPVPNPTPTPVPAPTPIPVATPGFEFDLRTKPRPSFAFDGWNFPVDNSSFGVKTFNHVVAGTTFPAPVALFFPSLGYQHPDGGPLGFVPPSPGVQATVTPTPNWLFYYSQLYPYRLGHLDYIQQMGSRCFAETGDIAIGDEARGLLSRYRPTILFAIPPAPAPVAGQTPAPVYATRVGTENVRGLDTYARIVTHESVHTLLYRLIQAGAIDLDGDGMPDDMEPAMGLNPKFPDTTGWGGEYALTGDQETFATMCEAGVLAPSTDDWADDGFNFGSPPPPNRTQRIDRIINPIFQGQNLFFPNAGASLSANVKSLGGPTP